LLQLEQIFFLLNMSFVDSFKKWFNVGGVHLAFEMERNIPKANAVIQGKIKVTSDGERHVKKIMLTLKQRRDVYRNGSHSVEYMTIGQKSYDVDYQMKAGDAKVLDFQMSVKPQETFTGNLFNKATDALQSKGGILGQIGEAGAFVKNLEMIYQLEVKTDIEGTIMNPNETTQIKLF